MKVFLKFTIMAILISVALFLTTTKMNRELKMPKNLCFSTIELIRRQNVLGLLAAPFYMKKMPSLAIEIVSVIILLIFYLQQRHTHENLNLPRIIPHIFLTIAIYIVFHLLLCLALFYLAKSRAIIVSHLNNDCSSGPHFITVPLIGIVLHLRNEEDTGKVLSFLAFILCILLQTLNVFVQHENYFSCVGLLIVGYLITKHSLHPLSNKNKLKEDSSYNGLLIIAAILGFTLAREISLKTNYSKDVSTSTPNIAIGIMSMIRRSNQRYLSTTLDSILTQLPQPVEANKIKIVIISFTNYTEADIVFKATEELMNANPEARQYLDFQNGTQLIQEFIFQSDSNYSTQIENKKKAKYDLLDLHVATTLNYLMTNVSWADWIMIHEDDFPLCDNRWEWLVNSLGKISKSGKSLFFATGGAGIALRKEIVPFVIAALMDETLSIPSDIVMQQCLRGKLKGHCKDSEEEGLAISSHLIFRHIGFVSTMGHKYVKKEGRWGCGWVHPFNGDPDVKVIHTDVN